jgi:uncharacterized protein
MSIYIIPVNKLSPESLQRVIEEFISRNGTDYGEIESPLETNFRQVKYKLEKGSAVLIYDDGTKTTNILLADDPILKKIDALGKFTSTTTSTLLQQPLHLPHRRAAPSSHYKHSP